MKTVRPFVFDEIVLTEEAENEANKINLEDKDSITAYLRERVSFVDLIDHDWVEADRLGRGFDTTSEEQRERDT